MKERIKNIIGAGLAACSIILCVTVLSYSAITQISGLAVSGTGTSNWSNLKDAGRWGDPQTTGIGSMALWGYTGTGSNFERIRGSAANGISVNQTPSGAGFFSLKRTDITAASVSFTFGFTSRKVLVEAPLTNSDDVCIDWLGNTAVCPAVNTSGDARLAPGTAILLDDYAIGGIAAIAASGTQTVNVTGWN